MNIAADKAGVNGQAHARGETTNAPSVTGVLDRQVPFNVEAEVAVLGSIIIDRDAIIKIADWLKPEHFYIDAHAALYEIMLDLYRRREPGDFVTLHAEMNRQGKSYAIGGPAYLTAMAAAVPTSVHCEYYARIVERTHWFRTVITLGGTVASLGYAEDRELEEVADDIEQLTLRITRRDQGEESDSTASAIGGCYYDHIQDLLEQVRQNGGKPVITGVETGFFPLDILTGGIQPGEMMLVGAASGAGKSAFETAMMYHNITQGQMVVMFSLEMSRQQIFERLISIHTAIPVRKLRMGWLTDDEAYLVTNAVGYLTTLPFRIFDEPGMAIEKMLRIARRLGKREQKPVVYLVDYLQLMTTNRKFGNREQEVGQMAWGLKQLAREEGAAVVVAAQLNRKIEERPMSLRRPMKSDLRDSGAPIQHSDMVVLIDRRGCFSDATPEQKKSDKAILILDKNRQGETVDIDAHWNGAKMHLTAPPISMPPQGNEGGSQ